MLTVMRARMLATVILLALAAGGLGYAATSGQDSEPDDEVEPIVVPRERPDRGDRIEDGNNRCERDERRRAERKERCREDRNKGGHERRGDTPPRTGGFRPAPRAPTGEPGGEPGAAPALPPLPPATPERDDDDGGDDGSEND